MKPLLALLAIVATLLLMWSVAAVRLQTPKTPAKATLTIADYESITLGLSIEEVEGFIGKPTNYNERKGLVSKTTTAQGTWQGKRGYIILNFTDGLVSGKSQNGLPPSAP